MTPPEAAQLLDLPPAAAPDRVEARFNELRLKLEEKIAKAPTPGLKAKYRESLDEITQAFEVLTLAADASALPVLQRQSAKGAGQGAGTAAVPQRAPDPGTPKSKIENRKSGTEFLVVAVIAAVVLAGGGWWVLRTRAENERQARIAEARQAEAARQAEEARRTAEAERIQREKEMLTLRTRLAELQVVYESAQKVERSVERELAELRNRDRARPAQPGQAPDIAQQVLTRQIEALDHYLGWLRATLPGHPASLARARAVELVAAAVLEPARAGVLGYQEELAKLKEQIETRAPDLPLIARQVRGEPVLAQWRTILAEELKKDQEATSWLPQGATRLSGDRELAKLIITRFGQNPADIPADFPAALAWLEQQALAGKDFRLMLLLADLYLASDRVPHDEDIMFLWRQRAAEAGDAETKYFVATTANDGLLPWNVATRVRWLRQAAEAGKVEAMRELSHYAGRQIERPPFSTLEEERQRAAAGSATAAEMVFAFEHAGEIPLSLEEGLGWLRKAAEGGDAESTLLLAGRHALGNGVEFDWDKANELYARHPQEFDSLVHFATAYANGWGVEEDQARAFGLYLQAAQIQPMHYLLEEIARRHASGLGVPQSEAKAIDYYRQLSLGGSAEGESALRARGLAPNGLPWAEAVKVWQTQPDDGWSLLWLGEAHEHGRGVASDPVKAAALYAKAAAKYLSPARVALARCHLEGRGVGKDEKKAVELLVAAGGPVAKVMLGSLGLAPNGQAPEKWIEEMRAQAESGQAWAYSWIGDAYAEGTGFTPDPAAAVKWYRQAAEQGYGEAMFKLARCLAEGRGVPRDEVAAAEWFQKAARGGIGDAMLALGRCHANGTGVAKDEALAIHWTWMAAVRNIPEAKAELRRLRAARGSAP